MTKVTVYRDGEQWLGFDCSGHAGYARRGRDIVCAGASILVQNTVNAIGQLTDEEFSCEADKESGEIRFRLEKPAGHDAKLLLDAMLMGLEGIADSYGGKYLQIVEKPSQLCRLYDAAKVE